MLRGSHRSQDHEVVNPDTIRAVDGLGMPIRKQPGQYGKLLIKFQINFPQKLGHKERDQLKKLFPNESAPPGGADKSKLATKYTVEYTECASSPPRGLASHHRQERCAESAAKRGLGRRRGRR